MIPFALTIAGSDSSGGAGIQADLKTFAAHQVFGTSAITCITAQNPGEVIAISPVPPEIVFAQIKAVFDWHPVPAVKTGMLFSADIIKQVVRALRQFSPQWLVVDPVMVASSGAVLLEQAAIQSLTRDLLPIARLITPNTREAEILADMPIKDYESVRRAAKKIHDRFHTAVLLKGGHLPVDQESCDYFYDGLEDFDFRASFLPISDVHGTGCTLSAAITAGLATGKSLKQSIQQAKDYITQSLQSAVIVQKRHTLRHFR
ncbi:MAG: bifunctional hydroxymethylpyrimidine kinase/phosphomethylpyrimidine kinase [SAR324 cluster bacterium]|nr:bifunctional hydroxymethylpyrimidine kinase/phosphomethylpyrimidine kinase [SAR324 cluster bacterium]